MATLFDSTDVTVEIAFGDDPLETSPTWTDVTAYVRSLNIDRGRSSEYSDYSAGTARIDLDNRDRRFDPDHTAGAYAPNVKPMVPVRITTQYSTGTTHTMFYGFVLGFPTSYDTANSDAITRISAVDANRVLANGVLSDSAYEQIVLSDTTEPYYYLPHQENSFLKADVIRNIELEYVYTSFGAATIQEVDGKYPLGASKMIYSDLSYAIQPAGAPDLDLIVPRAMDFWWSPYIGDYTASKFYGDNVNYMGVICSSMSGLSISVTYSDEERNKCLETSPFTNGLYVSFDVSSAPSLNTWGGAGHIAVYSTTTTMVLEINGVIIDTVPLLNGTGSWIYFSRPAEWSLDGVGLSHVALYDQNPATSAVAYDTNNAQDHYDAGYLAFKDELTSVRLGRALDEINFPSAWRDIETGVRQVGVFATGGTTAQSYLSQIATGEQGEGFVSRSGYVKFLNQTSVDVANPVAFFGDYLSTDLDIVDVQVDGANIETVRNSVIAKGTERYATAKDVTSIGEYGLASEELDVPLIDNRSVLQAIADKRLSRVKDPRSRIVGMTVDVRSDTSALVDVMAPLELGEDAVVAFTPTDVGSALWRAVRVQGISHQITPSSWSTHVYLAPGTTNENGPLFILNHATYGELDSGNKLG